MDKMEKGILMEEGKKNSFAWLWILVAVVIIGLVVWYAGQFKGLGLTSSTRSSDFQAVFLSNNQVYFGKISNINDQYTRLMDVYYLQVTQTLQPKSQTPQQNINLIKLGGELHGPKDEMLINRDHVLFIEDLKPDSQIVKAILEQEKK